MRNTTNGVSTTCARVKPLNTQERLLQMISTSGTEDFGDMFSQINAAMSDYTNSALNLMHYTSTPIESEDDVLERAEVMDEIMDMAKHENDVVLLFANAIADRIYEFEETLEMPEIPGPERLRELMKIRNVKQRDLKSVAPQSVISEILNGKREINLKQAKGLAEYFKLPVGNFIE